MMMSDDDDDVTDSDDDGDGVDLNEIKRLVLSEFVRIYPDMIFTRGRIRMSSQDMHAATSWWLANTATRM